MAEEIEVKLEAPPEFAVPDLADALAGAVPDALEVVELSATYWDSPALALLRAGVTLRHREGRWQAKVGPGEPDGGVLTRTEVEFDGPADAPPPEVIRLVRTLVRPEQLEPVARLDTRRRRVRLRRGEAVILEVADDTVEVVTDPHDPERLRFRELEVEAGPAGSVDDVHRCAAVLRQAGAHDAPARSKLRRVLGELGTTAPPSSRDIAGHPGPTASEDRLSAALGRVADGLCAADVRHAVDGDVAALWDAVREARGLVQAARALMPADIVDDAEQRIAALDADLGPAVDARGVADLEYGLRAGLDDAPVVAAADPQARAAEARAEGTVAGDALPELVDALRRAQVEAPAVTDHQLRSVLRGARIQARSLRGRPAPEPARAEAVSTLHAALLLVCGPACGATQDAAGVRSQLDLARHAATLRDLALDRAASAPGPTQAFACRAVAARADRALRTASRRARRRWLVLDAFGVPRATRR